MSPLATLSPELFQLIWQQLRPQDQVSLLLVSKGLGALAPPAPQFSKGAWAGKIFTLPSPLAPIDAAAFVLELEMLFDNGEFTYNIGKKEDRHKGQNK